MITTQEERYILDRAYIPEHAVGLMTSVSGSEPFLIEDYLCLHRENWIIVVGYPLENGFTVNAFETFVGRIKRKFKPQRLSLMAPELPHPFAESCLEHEKDDYYTLDIQNISVGSGLQHAVERAREHLTIERSCDFTEAHRLLTREFIERVEMHPRIRELFLRMPHYVGPATHSIILNAWDRNRNLAAFYIVDLATKDFSTYVLGCHSKKTYTAGASDLLLSEMIDLSLEYGKNYIHLGLGVNRGIRQFKKKWGGIPTLRYEMCELAIEQPSLRCAIKAMSQILKTG